MLVAGSTLYGFNVCEILRRHVLPPTWGPKLQAEHAKKSQFNCWTSIKWWGACEPHQHKPEHRVDVQARYCHVDNRARGVRSKGHSNQFGFSFSNDSKCAISKLQSDSSTRTGEQSRPCRSAKRCFSPARYIRVVVYAVTITSSPACQSRLIARLSWNVSEVMLAPTQHCQKIQHSVTLAPTLALAASSLSSSG